MSLESRKIRILRSDLQELHKLIAEGEKLKSKVLITKENYIFEIILAKNNNSNKVLGLSERRETKKMINHANKKIKKLDGLLIKIQESQNNYERKCKELKAVLDSYIREDIYNAK